MKVNIKRVDNAFLMEAKSEQELTVRMDAGPSIGGSGSAQSPMQLVLSAIGGCSAIDIILILKKQKQRIDSFSISVNAEREDVKDGAAVFKKIHLVFSLSGEVDQEKAQRAADLSMTKYCSVAKMLEKTAEITYEVEVNKTKS